MAARVRTYVRIRSGRMWVDISPKDIVWDHILGTSMDVYTVVLVLLRNCAVEMLGWEQPD